MRVTRREFVNTEDGAIYLHKVWEVDMDTAIDLAVALLEFDTERRVMYFYESINPLTIGGHHEN